jgi:hypothetical protein
MRRRRGVLSWIRDIAFTAAILLLAILAARVVTQVPVPPRYALSLQGALVFLLALLVYFASHFARIARVALIAADTKLSLRRLINLHFFTSAVSLGLPFKLGDAYRALELSGHVGGLTRGIVVVGVERVFDVALILLLIAVAFAFGSALSPDLAPVLAASILFVAVTAAALLLLPDNLRRIATYVIRRYDRPWTVRVLRGIANARTVVGSVSRMLKGRYSSLFSLTLVIWAFELLCLGLILNAAGMEGGPVDALLRFLSSITEGATLLGRSGPGDWSWTLEPTLMYLAATQIPLAFAGLLAGATLLPSRWRAFAALKSDR